MLIKLTPGVDFTSVLYAVVTKADPKRAKIQSSSQAFLAPFGSVRVKGASRMLMKLFPGD